MQKKYAYKQRANYTGYKKKTKNAKKQSSFLEKMLNAFMFCVAVLILLYVLKLCNVSFAVSVIDKAKTVFSEDSSYLKLTKEKIVGFMDDTVKSVFGESSASTEDALALIMPCEGEVITQFGKSNETYNIRSSLGLLIKVKPDCDVVAAMDGEVKEILPSAYGGMRMIVVQDNVTVVYDGVNAPLVQKDTHVAQGQLLGKMSEATSKGDVLCFEVYIDNMGVDPAQYIKTVEQKESEEKTSVVEKQYGLNGAWMCDCAV